MNPARNISGTSSVRLMCLWQVPFELGGEQSKDEYDCKADHDGKIGIISVQDGADDGSDDAGAGIEVLDKDHGDITGTYIPDHSAAHTGQHTEEDLQEQVVKCGTG